MNRFIQTCCRCTWRKLSDNNPSLLHDEPWPCWCAALRTHSLHYNGLPSEQTCPRPELLETKLLTQSPTHSLTLAHPFTHAFSSFSSKHCLFSHQHMTTFCLLDHMLIGWINQVNKPSLLMTTVVSTVLVM